MSISVLVVDDSALIRDVLRRTLGRDGDIEVVGTAADAHQAREQIKALNPDVVTLDIEMPNMNGLEFLDRLMRLRPLPVVMVSTLTSRGASETLLALELGAVDFVAKPGTESTGGIEAFGESLRDKIAPPPAATCMAGRSEARRCRPKVGASAGPEGAVIALEPRTGGVEAIRVVLSGLPPDGPPVVIVQHMPPGFTTRFAARLNDVTGLTVHEADDRMVLEAGHAYVARGDHHLRVERRSGQLRCRVIQDARASGHRPSVDVLSSPVADVVGPLAVGALLTGMGRDGASGLKAMREAGAHTVGQNQASALVFGMPRVAFEEGAVVEQASLEAIAARLTAALGRIRPAA